MVGQIRRVVILRVVRHVHQSQVVMERRREIVGLGTYDAVEPFKSRTSGPLVERTSKARLPWGEFMALAEHGSAVSVEFHNFWKWHLAGGKYGGLTWKGGG